MKSIITISRQFGAGGSTIGRAVAEKLGYYYCDKDMILRAALESGSLTPQEISKYESDYMLLWSCTHYCTDLHSLSYITWVVYLFYIASCKSDLVTI